MRDELFSSPRFASRSFLARFPFVPRFASRSFLVPRSFENDAFFLFVSFVVIVRVKFLFPFFFLFFFPALETRLLSFSVEVESFVVGVS